MRQTIPKHRFSEPRRNLPGRKGVATEEDRFTLAFARAYLGQFAKIHSSSDRTQMAMAREIPVNGYGIADLVVIAWSPEIELEPTMEELMTNGNVTTRAFESKLKDWRSALSQAARYRYFANQAIVVLPEKSASNALPYLATFQKIKVGLWSFDQSKNLIHAIYTPRCTKPKVEKYRVKVGNAVHVATKQALPIVKKGRSHTALHSAVPSLVQPLGRNQLL